MSRSAQSPELAEPLPLHAPFAIWLGLQYELGAPGQVLVRMQPRAEVLNRHGVVHGGVLSALLDSAMARAARSVAGVRELGGTTDLHLQFLSPANGALQARAWVDRATQTLAFCRGDITDAKGCLVTTGSTTLRLRR